MLLASLTLVLIYAILRFLELVQRWKTESRLQEKLYWWGTGTTLIIVLVQFGFDPVIVGDYLVKNMEALGRFLLQFGTFLQT